MKQLSLFDEILREPEIQETAQSRSRQEVFEDYDGFVDKFEAKKTTDDCYTPEKVYDAILAFVGTLTPLEGRPIVRPFFPGGDFVNYEYPKDCIVVDNPPFSILSKIVRFYSAHDVPFFLFGPALTLFTAPDCDLTYIIADADIIYDNGAVVRTGFITNLPSDIRIWCCPQLKQAIAKAQEQPPSSVSVSPPRRESSVPSSASARRRPARTARSRICSPTTRLSRRSSNSLRRRSRSRTPRRRTAWRR